MITTGIVNPKDISLSQYNLMIVLHGIALIARHDHKSLIETVKAYMPAVLGIETTNALLNDIDLLKYTPDELIEMGEQLVKALPYAPKG